jgi:hypothetical protein
VTTLRRAQPSGARSKDWLAVTPQYSVKLLFLQTLPRREVFHTTFDLSAGLWYQMEQDD